VPKFTGMRPTVLGPKTSKSKGFLIKKMAAKKPKSPSSGFEILAKATESRGVDLNRGRYYRLVADQKAREQGFLRVVDASGEDYLYPARIFQMVRVPAYKARHLLFQR
jgi:hypothetical protein